MFAVIDNQDGAILAVCFEENIAKQILSGFPVDATVDGDEETIRFVYQDTSQFPEYLIGQILVAMGHHMQRPEAFT